MRIPTLSRLLFTAALLALPATVRAQFVVYTDLASFLAATSNAGTDTFEDLSLDASTPSPLTRSAGAFGYTASVNTTSFFGAGSAADRWLSTNTATDIVTFTGFGSTVRGVGGSFFGTNIAGSFSVFSTLIVTASNAGGVTSRTLLNTPLGGFLGFVSTSDIFSLTIESVQPDGGGFVWPTVNDFVLAEGPAQNVVPEPREMLLLATGLFGLIVLRLRRRRA
ncbi:MAG: PEP-CTERM sorting domain-containing protein [Gemmatimonadaceae bacterium]|nr:PEP-CTERM sorting domain-containing protein [Gemmatimonadaceae bacterium]